MPTDTHKQSRRPTERHKEETRHPKQFLFPVIDKILMPSTHRRPEKTQTKTGDRSPDQSRPTARPRDRQTHPERTYLADGRRSGPLVLAGASTSAPCAGYDAGRDGSRPSRPPHGHARCSRGGQSRLPARQWLPAQLQRVARKTPASLLVRVTQKWYPNWVPCWFFS